MAAHLAYYEVLGLDAPPADRKAVKRAYSKKLKVTRPEDDPDGFMRLRDAHDLALNILSRQAENAVWEAKSDVQQITDETTHLPDVELVAAATPEASSPQGLTYSDMLPKPEPEPEPEPVSDTSYAIGPTPNFDAPVSFHAPVEPQAPKLIKHLNEMLSDPKQANDRERWNILFRKARKLDIDDYVDFEQLLLDNILRFHGYFDDHPNHNTPEKMPQKLSPSIAASLFKTMSWDQVNKRGYYRSQQIEWLERRVSLRKRGSDPAPIPQPDSGSSGNVWFWLIGVFVVLKIVQLLAHL